MPLIRELIPYLETLAYWKAEQIPVTAPVVIQAGQQREIATYQKSGYLHQFKISMNNPNGFLMATYRSLQQSERTLIAQPLTLNADGLTMPNPPGLWVSTYNAGLNLYVVEYTPAPGAELGFQDYLRVVVQAPAGANLTINNLTMLSLLIPDRQRFLKFLNYVNGGDGKEWNERL